jgi:alpha-galactosidase
MISYRSRQSRLVYAARFTAILLFVAGITTALHAQSSGTERALQIAVSPADGTYAIGMRGSSAYALRAGIGVEVDARWLHAADYPRHRVGHSPAQGYLGEATDWQVTCSGLSGQPDLIYHLRAYASQPFGDIQATVRNTTGKAIHVEAIRSLEATPLLRV